MHELLHKVSKVNKSSIQKDKTIPSMKITLPTPDEEKEVIKLSKAGVKINTTRNFKSINTKLEVD
jgi:hypothetical protein